MIELHTATATAADAAECVRLRGLTRENPVSVERLRSLGITVQSWADDITSGALFGVVARRGAQMIGYCFGDTASGEVVVLVVMPEGEAQGLGRQLLQAVVAHLRALGHARLFLGCSSDPSVRSYGFYRHLGWRSTGEVDALGDEVLELWVE